MTACSIGHASIVADLLRNGADPCSKGAAAPWTPLAIAAARLHCDVAQLLLDASPTARSDTRAAQAAVSGHPSFGCGCAAFACRLCSGRLVARGVWRTRHTDEVPDKVAEMLCLLRDAGVPVDTPSGELSPLSLALRAGYHKAAILLIAAGAQGDDGTLAAAVRAGRGPHGHDESVLSALLRHRQQDPSRASFSKAEIGRAVAEAIDAHCQPSLEQLLALPNADLEAPREPGMRQTPVLQCVHAGALDCLLVLIRRGAVLEPPGGPSALFTWLQLEYGYGVTLLEPECGTLLALLFCGAQTRAQQWPEGRTVVMEAVRNGADSRVVRALVAADPALAAVKDSIGLGAADYALAAGRYQLADVLRSQAAKLAGQPAEHAQVRCSHQRRPRPDCHT